jgi:hypothetical protein
MRRIHHAHWQDKAGVTGGREKGRKMKEEDKLLASKAENGEVTGI